MKITKRVKLVGTVDALDAITYFGSRNRIMLTSQQLKELIEKYMPLNNSFWHDMIGEYLISSIEEQGGGEVSMDTSTGDDIGNALCQKLMNRDWPCGTDMEGVNTQERNEFWTEFHTKMIQGGYKPDEDWLETYLE